MINFEKYFKWPMSFMLRIHILREHHELNKITSDSQGPHLLTLFNFNPGMDM